MTDQTNGKRKTLTDQWEEEASVEANLRPVPSDVPSDAERALWALEPTMLTNLVQWLHQMPTGVWNEAKARILAGAEANDAQLSQMRPVFENFVSALSELRRESDDTDSLVDVANLLFYRRMAELANQHLAPEILVELEQFGMAVITAMDDGEWDSALYVTLAKKHLTNETIRAQAIENEQAMREHVMNK